MSRRVSGLGLARRPHADTGGVTPLILFGSQLIHWYRADDPGITLNAGKVSSWPNRAGVVGNQHLVQATAANQPAFSATSFNGGPGVTGTGGGCFLLTDINTPNYGAIFFSMWLVIKPSTNAVASTGAVSAGLSSTSLPSSTPMLFGRFASPATELLMSSSCSGGSEIITGPATAANPTLMSYRLRTTTANKARVNDLSFNGTQTTAISNVINRAVMFTNIGTPAPDICTIAEWVVIRHSATDQEDFIMRRYFLSAPQNAYYGLSYTP